MGAYRELAGEAEKVAALFEDVAAEIAGGKTPRAADLAARGMDQARILFGRLAELERREAA